MTRYLKVALAAVALLCAPAAIGGGPAVWEELDWLIVRHNGEWRLEEKGPTGRVHKKYPNQEVLRLAQGSSFVEVVSMPPIGAGESAYCTQRARRDARDGCSSSFLLCRPDAGGPIESAIGLVAGGGAALVELRTRLVCSIDVEAVLQAAREVGLI